MRKIWPQSKVIDLEKAWVNQGQGTKPKKYVRFGGCVKPLPNVGNTPIGRAIDERGDVFFRKQMIECRIE
jgi:hypothetical protein